LLTARARAMSSAAPSSIMIHQEAALARWTRERVRHPK
jgi:hypothetical protein